MSDSSKNLLREHLRVHAVLTGGPFTLRSGEVSEYYIDGRRTFFDGAGARYAGEMIAGMLPETIDAVGGMTMGADPIAVATAIAATRAGRPLRAFSVRKTPKDHGTGGRLVGPVQAGDRVAALEDTSTTGGAFLEAVDAMIQEGLSVELAICMIDRSGGAVARRMQAAGIPYVAVFEPEDLGIA